MKRYEKMSKEEINNAYCSCATSQCSNCVANKYCNDTLGRLTCVERIYDWLQKETKKVPRYEFIKTQEDLDRLRNEFVSICEKQLCSGCKYSSSHSVGNVGCFAAWLKEGIEVEE